MHESNTFNRALTDRAAFEATSLKVGDAVLHEWGRAHHEVGGFIEGAKRFGYELYPTLMASAMASGPVTGEALDGLVDEIIARVKAAPKLDGLLLALHGAMVAQGFPEQHSVSARASGANQKGSHVL